MLHYKLLRQKLHITVVRMVHKNVADSLILCHMAWTSQNMVD